MAPVGTHAWLHGLPGGSVVSSDTGMRELPARRLYSARYDLSGKPDYLVATRQGLVPVGGQTRAHGHRASQISPAASAGLLPAARGGRGQAAPYGLLRYAETFKVDYNIQTRAHLLGVIEEMRRAKQQDDVHRSHEQPAPAAGCGYREVCEESLWPDHSVSRIA